MTEDVYCMECGSKLDPVTGKCPKCEPIEPAKVDPGKVEPPTETTKERDTSGATEETVATTSPDRTEDIKPETTRSPPPAPPPPPPPVSEPSKPKKKGPVAKIIVGIVLAIVVIFIIFMAIGFLAGPTPDNGQYEGGTGSTANTQLPSPTDTFSPGTEVYVQVEKDPITDGVRVTFSGGPGQRVLRELQITLSRSDGQVLTATLPPQQQESVTLQGTSGDDRVEVFAVYYSGSMNLIYDQILKERTHS